MVRPAHPPAPVGLILPTFTQDTNHPWGPVPDAEPAAEPIEELRRTCRRGEELGAGALWACDHLFWHGPCLEAMTTLAVAATATRHAVLGTCVMQLPLRRAPEVAKQATTLQALTSGRFILGVGVGSHEGEYVQAGIDFHERGASMDAGIHELRRSWATGGSEGGEGAARYRQLPLAEAVPIWVGGSSEAALRRAARLADGWMPLFLSAAAYEQALERLGKEVERAGRPDDSVLPAMVLFVAVDDDPVCARKRGTAWMASLYGIPAKAFERHLVSGSADEVAPVVRAFQRAGARHVAVYITDDKPLPQFERLMDSLGSTRDRI